MPSQYDLDKIKFATDGPTFEKAVGLYEDEKVTKFREEFGRFNAVVLGTKPYKVWVDGRHFDQGNCDCYLGQNDILCKHMVAVAIRAVTSGKPLHEEDTQLISGAVCSGRIEELNKQGLLLVKKEITGALKYIKPYNGPSRLWFSYQSSLSEGTNRLSKIVSEMPVGEQTAAILINLLLRLDKKLCYNGVDDSDGTVGGFMTEVVGVLEEFARLEPRCVNTFQKLIGHETCFEWEEPLVYLYDERGEDFE